MAVGYLARVARRALAQRGATSPRASTGALKPATPSGSPLAEVDQRLHLDLFEGAPIGFSAESLEAPGFDETTSEPGDISRSAVAMPPAGESRPSRDGAEQTHPSVTPSPPIAQPRFSQPAQHPGQGGPRENRRASAENRPAQKSGIAPTTEPLHGGPSAGFEDPQPPSTVVQSPPTTNPGLPKSLEPTAMDPSDGRMDQMMEALDAAQRWVAGAPARQPTSPSGEASKEGPEAPARATAQPPPAITPVAATPKPADWPAATQAMRAAAQKSQPTTRVEIGSIEVEVVAPPTAPVQQPQRASARRSASTLSGPRHAPSFGWRQR